jgi:hypothetical protein
MRVENFAELTLMGDFGTVVYNGPCGEISISSSNSDSTPTEPITTS